MAEDLGSSFLQRTLPSFIWRLSGKNRRNQRLEREIRELELQQHSQQREREAQMERFLQAEADRLECAFKEIERLQIESNEKELAKVKSMNERANSANEALLEDEIARGRADVIAKRKEAFQEIKQHHEESLASLKHQFEDLKCELARCGESQKVIEKNMRLLDESYQLFDPDEKDSEARRRKVVLVGNTGDGKSTLGNRLWGDASRRGNDGPFPVSGRAQSLTSDVSSTIFEAFDERFCVVDTPGMGDSNGEDADLSHGNKIVSYLKGVAEIDAFIFVRNFRKSRLTGPDKELLFGLVELLGEDFWRNVMFVFTRVDDEDDDEEFAEEMECFRDEIVAEFGVDVSVARIPFLGIGKRDFAKKREKILGGVCRFPDTFCCDGLVLPLETLKTNVRDVSTRSKELEADMLRVTVQIKSCEMVLDEISCQLTKLI